MAMDSKECSLLPLELLEEILCRVPTKSLIRFKLTCKRWLTLFQDKRFIYKHLALIQEQIIRTNHMVKIINPVIGSCLSLSLPHEFKVSPEIRYMVHCDGLLLCIIESGPIAVWNPCLNQVRWVKTPTCYPVCCNYGIGYNDGLYRDGYKILRFVDCAFTKNEYANTGAYKPEVDIYEFKSNSWKTFEVSMDWHVVCRGVSLKGNMYWIARWTRKPGFFIQSFTFSTETFEPLCTLPVKYGTGYDVVALSPFRGDDFSLLHQGEDTTKIEVWVTNKAKNGVSNISWTKFFSVTRPDVPVLRFQGNLSNPMHFIDKNNRIVVCCEEILADEKNVAAVNVYLIGEGEIKRQGEIDRNLVGFSWPYISGYVYLPSLVPVPT